MIDPTLAPMPGTPGGNLVLVTVLVILAIVVLVLIILGRR